MADVVAVQQSKTPAQRTMRRAWIALAFIPVTFVVAMVVGEGLIDAAGYPSGGSEVAPIGTRLLIGIPLTLLMLAPAVLAALWGFRAKRLGQNLGDVPGWFGLIVAAYLVVVTAINLIFEP